MSFDLAPVDGLDEDELKEMANRFAAKCQQAAQQTVKDAVIAGNALNELRTRTEHGKHGSWRAWLKSNFDYSHETARTYMTLAANVNRLTFEPASIKSALRAIADEREQTDEQEHVPRSERKTGRVEVAETNHPEKSDSSPASDPDPIPAPKSNTKHSPATAKAKEADRPAPAPITPEIVEEPEVDPVQEWIRSHSLADLVSAVVGQIADDKAKRKAAKELRKLADQLDPPAVGAPSVDAVEHWARENGLQDFDADKFFNHYELAGWKYGKAKTPIKDWKRAAANAYAGGKGWAVNGANRLPF
jgi:hypothetical protein